MSKRISATHSPATANKKPKHWTPSDVKDLRPISILPYLSKILEKVVHGQLMSCKFAVVEEQIKYFSFHFIFQSMKDEESIVKQSERAVVIRDKYPKAKLHYLVLPQENISSIYRLDNTYVSLIEEFGTLFEQIKNENPEYTLRAGFHAVPSMQRLHMHIISTDMISPCLKTKQHWNSFTTKFFLPYEDVLKKLKENGTIKRMSNEEHKSLMATPLKCNQCSFAAQNMPKLKEHLLIHK